GGLQDGWAAAKAAEKVGLQRAEVLARTALGYMLFYVADIPSAREQCKRGLALARRLGARRFEADALIYLGRIQAIEGRKAEAVELIEQAYDVCRETGVTYAGPWALGALFLVSDDPRVRELAAKEAERILSEKECVSHNYLSFYIDAMEASFEGGDWAGVERYAAALENYTHEEPLPCCDFYIARGRALAAYGSGRRDEATARELRRLRDEAERVGFRFALPALDKALEGLAEDTVS
ncbi:MAG: adenylate/guanylate cyclase domain-containing protein, partial [Alphaproteobacteria bacterium]